jgi:methyl-accepting chemotaxis protein
VASKETADLINSRVVSTENAAKIAEKSAANLKVIVTETKKVTDLAGEIATASQEQSDGINQISKAVSTMDTVTQQNAANAEELAAASEELTAQAESLKTIVGELAAQVGDVGMDLNDSETAGPGIGEKDLTLKSDVASRKYKPAVRITENNRAQKAKNNGNGSRKGKKPLSGTPEELIPLSGDFTGF